MQNNIEFVFNMLQFDVVYSTEKGKSSLHSLHMSRGNRGDEKWRQHGVRKTVATLCPTSGWF